MTLIVSLRIPDGIVIAGDSLSTSMAQGQLDININAVCPHCKRNHKIQQKVPIPDLPVTSFSYAQKIFPFYGKFGVGTFGAGLLANQSIYLAMRLIEQRLKEEEISFDGVTEVAQQIGSEFHKLLQKHFELERKPLTDLPPNQYVLGFQVVGYDGVEPKTIEVTIGKEVSIPPPKGLGCHVSGSDEIAKSFSELYKNPSQKPTFHLFSLQDAIDYAEFLIRTTIAHQRFSQISPKVGGDIDIALVTPFNGFRWIRQKPLGKILEGRSNETDHDY